MEDVTIIKNFLSKEESDIAFNYLLDNINWHDRLNIMYSEETVKINRKMAYVSDNIIDYSYANFYFKGELWNDTLKDIKLKIEARISAKFNSVLLNLYSNGKDEIKWHSDKEYTLGENPIIACVNLGVTRKFWFLKKDTGNKHFIEVENGDLLVMGENCQKNYLHAILKEKGVTEPRISLTYRRNFM